MYAHHTTYRLKNFHNILVKMSREERDFIYASIHLHVENEKKATKKGRKRR